jgi:hypothetical protein
MMGKYYLHILIFYFIINSNLLAQSIILRPAVGFRFFKTKQDNSYANNTDPFLNRSKKFDKQTANIALELMYLKSSFELVFTSQGSGYYFDDYFKATTSANDGVNVFVGGNGGTSQFQLNYNYFIQTKNRFFSNKKPFFGLGFGLGLNRPAKYYLNDSSFRFFSGTSVNMASTIQGEQFTTSLNKFSYSLVLKSGLALKRKNIERARLSIIYNLGLNKYLKHDINYSQNNVKYNTVATFRGTQSSIQLSIPIYLKRNK